MSKINNAHKFTVAAAFGAAAIFGMLSFGSSAEAAKSVASCQGATANQAMSCCEKFVKENGRPLWMIQTRTSCREAAVCRGGKSGIIGIAEAAVKRCHIHVVEIIKEGGGEERGSDPGRGSSALPGKVESPCRKGIAPDQYVGANPCRRSHATSPGFALVKSGN